MTASRTDVPAPSQDTLIAESDRTRKSILVRFWHTGKIVVKDPAGTGSLIALLIGIIMSSSSSVGVTSSGVRSVGYAIVGAAAFSFIYQFWANDALVHLITSKVEGAQRKANQEIENQWQSIASDTTASINIYASQFISLHKRHWPLETYPESNIPNAEFN